ncbi:hypothetical protein HK100_012194 [Physocladia obscura]|uniref:RNI-like protein n=1 Tax=Physocladia obscura TaxID=109957 RepID=A0AAD5XHS6_9FUNG|nr:hypothetical protein HK100_012194 [Physocladia obscura]
MRYAMRDARRDIEAPRLVDASTPSPISPVNSTASAVSTTTSILSGDCKSNYVEIMCVSRSWLTAAAALLYRTLALRSTPRMLIKVTQTLLNPQASLPYAMLVKHITNYNSPEFDNSLLEMGDIDTLLQVCPMLSSFVFTASPLASNILVQSIADNCHRLAHLSLRECPVTDALINTLCSSCPRIAFLDLSFSLVSAASIPTIVDKLPTLSTLWLESILPSNTRVSFPSVPTSARTSLKSINLKNSGISDASPNLKTLLLDGCTSLTDDGIVSLSRYCANLEVLDLSFISPGVSDLSIYSIGLGLRTSIQVLSLCGCDAISVSAVQFLIDECCSSYLVDSQKPAMTQAARKSLNQLVLHGCTQIINSYLAEFDTTKTRGGIECMLESESLKRAVSTSAAVKPQSSTTASQHVSAATMAKLTGELQDYDIDRGELWMRAAFNTSTKMFGGLKLFDSDEPVTPKSASPRSSVISIKRASSNSMVTDSSSQNSRLPTPKSANVRQSSIGRPAIPSKLATPSKLARPSAAAPSTLRKPTKINFAAYADTTPSAKVLSPLAAKSRVSTITQSSYSRNSLGMSTPTKVVPIRTTVPNTSSSQTTYKPRTFKKFNDSTDDILGAKSAVSAPSTPSSRAGVFKPGTAALNRVNATPTRSSTISSTSSIRTTPAPKAIVTRQPVSSYSAPRLGTRQPSTPTLSSGSSVSSRSSVESMPKSSLSSNSLTGSDNDSSDDGGSSSLMRTSGLDKWRKSVGTSEIARTASNGGGLDKWRKPVAETTKSLVSGGLDKWRKSEGPMELTTGGGSLEKYRKNVSAGSPIISAGGGLEKYRKTVAVASPGSSRVKAAMSVRK